MLITLGGGGRRILSGPMVGGGLALDKHSTLMGGEEAKLQVAGHVGQVVSSVTFHSQVKDVKMVDKVDKREQMEVVYK